MSRYYWQLITAPLPILAIFPDPFFLAAEVRFVSQG